MAEVAPRAWVHPRDILATADTAFDRSHTLNAHDMPGKVEAASSPLSVDTPNTTIRWGFEGTAASQSGVGGRKNNKRNTHTFLRDLCHRTPKFGEGKQSGLS